jgi:hypothetical protein
MTILTPTFAQINGQGGAVQHITPAHEPLRTGEVPVMTTGLIPDPNSASGFRSAPQQAKPPLKVALIGTAPSSRMLAPFNDPTWQIWGCSPGNMNSLPRYDLWFELHSNLLWPEHESYGRPYIEWLKQQKCPVFMQERWPTLEGSMVPIQSIVPNAIPFPKDELVADFGPDFFTSSFAWMMAYAMKTGASDIALYGIDMASRDEYIRQRPGFYYFRQRARERGVRISAPHESDIMQSPPLYAYADSTPIGRKMMARRKEVADRVSGMDSQIGQLTHSKTYLQGALEDLDYFEAIWAGVGTELIMLQDENARLKTRIAEQEKAASAVYPPPPVKYRVIDQSGQDVTSGSQLEGAAV